MKKNLLPFSWVSGKSLKLVIQQPFYLLLSLFLFGTSLHAQCTFTSTGPFPVFMDDTDTETAPFSFSQANDIFDPALGAIVNVTSWTEVEICFWGDMNANNETFDVVIGGQTFSAGDYGFTPSQASPACQNFVITDAAAMTTDLADGDIDVTYNNFGNGWDNVLGDGDQFRAQVVYVEFDYDVPVTISNPGSACSDGTNLVFNATPPDDIEMGDVTGFQIFPATPGFSFAGTTATIDVDVANPGTYNVVYSYDVNGCEFEASQMVTVFAAPRAALANRTISCLPANGTVELGIMFDGGNDPGGTFTVQSGGGSVMGTTFDPPAGGGCFTIRYEVDNPDGCDNAPYQDEAILLVTEAPAPELTISGASSPACSDGGTVDVTIGRNSTGNNPIYTVDGQVVPVGALSLTAPATAGSIVYEICLTEAGSMPSCPGAPAPTDCNVSDCQSFTVFNDGNECGANAAFASECAPDPDAVSICDVDTNPGLTLTCSFFSGFPTLELVDASLSDVPGIANCDDDEICFEWNGGLNPDLFGGIEYAGPTIADLNPVAGIVCDILKFEICIPLPIVDDICIDPLPFDAAEAACDMTIGEFVLTALEAAVGGGGSSGIIIADTDGDGNFDFVLEEYDFPSMSDQGMPNMDCVPNNIEGESGYITIRNVVAWPFPAQDVCGVISNESINLLELLPIGAIPIVGVIIEDILAAASCNVELVFTDEETVRVPVFNSSAPVFANCNTSGYVFSEDGICDTEANWSIPVAYDGCSDDVLTYRGRTAGTDATSYNGTPPAVVIVTESGLYQTAGPIPGSDLAPGTYTVTYTAYSCAAIESTCTFDVVVTSGDPVLACPSDFVVRTDSDVCSAIVTGLSPIQGVSCATIIDYSIDFADGTNSTTTTVFSQANLGTHNDASGETFPLGESTVTYTMRVDINGDGDVDDTIDGTMETQTCDFTVTVQDDERPVAECIDVDVRLDNTGNITVFAEDQADGSTFVNGGSVDNCDTDLDILVAKPGGAFEASVNYDCTETGYNLVTLQVTDDAGNVSTCLSQVHVEDFFEGITFDLDIPEICLENNNPSQLDFSNYLVITLPDGTTLTHDEVENNTYLGDAVGGFGITVFAPALGTTSVDPGTVDTDGVYTMGDGTGFVTVSYVLALPGAVVQNGNVALSGCLEIVHSTFELRQPLDMESPECECIVQNDRVVDLGEISGGLEPYTIQYGGVQLDVDSDGVADDVDGEYTYDTSTGANIGDFTEDLGNLLVDYTQPTWSFTVVDARGCELFRSGSCDNDDETGTPMIDCTALGAVTLYTRNEEDCTVQDTWEHTLPTDNCDVILYTYTIENPDGTIAGPFDISALLNPDITMPLPDQFYGEYDFQHHSPTENVSTVTYYAEDAVGNFTQCSFTVTVIDDDPPYFINCPEPAVIVDAPPTWCAAFANYSLPLAEDNCGSVVVTQIDDTGLTSGSLFPVGITINTFEAVDETGNSITCDVKIIVNDYHTPPTIACPDDVVDTNDEGDCGAVIDDIAPSGITDNCPENLTVVYRIQDEEGNEVASGFDDASGNFFELGTSTVSYSVQDMPLLLITEVTHELSNTVDGSPATTPSCFDGVVNGDETDVDCGGGVCTSCNCPENEVIVEIVLDNNPGETTWAITEPNDGAVLASGGPYAAGMAGMTITESVCLSNDCYDFVIRDAGLDGIAAGGGSYTVTAGDEVLASGGDFGTREVTNFCLDGAPPAGSLVGTAGSRDAIEVTNFGSANLDVSCLMIERVYAGGSESYAVPAGAILAPGGVLTIHFGDGHDDPANNVYYVPGTTDLDINEPTAYIVSLSRSVLDVAVMNGFDVSGVLVPPAYDLGGLTVADYWSGTVGPIYGGGIVRTTVWDTDTADDFVPGEACIPVTIGMLNPGLAQPTPNGASTAIQAQPTVRVECDFTVTISDDEPAVCGLYSEYFDYVTDVIDVEYGECVETIIPVGDDFNVADVNLNLSGSAGDLGNLTVTLISPEGTEIELIEAICAGTDDIEFTLDGDFGPPVDISCGDLNNAGELFVPVGDIEAFNGEAMQGNWILQIGHNGQESVDPAALTAILFISARDPYTQGDEVLDNDPGECGADFTWFHPILFDNCPGGSMVMEIFFEGELDATANYPIFPENTEITRFFPVGISTVTYTLTDAAGNTSTCGFTVEVLDVEFPTLTCPPDLVIQLGGGECTTIDYPTIPVTADDNCPGFTFSSIPPGTPVPIGDTIITLIVTDASGNATECTYNLTVLENLPDDPPACVANQNVTLGLDCEAEITADMILSGEDYRCYDNYDVTIYYQGEDGGPGEIIPTSPFAGISEVGLEIVAEVCDPRTGFCCWGYVLIEFKDAPEFICPADATVRCTDSTLPSVLGEPIITSCVPGGAIVEFDDVIQDNGMCGDPRLVISRTWTVTDGEGNSSSCVQTITMDAFDLDQVVWPPDYDGIDEDVIDCAAALADPLITEPEALGFPTIDGSTEILTLSYCSAALSYTDEEFAICENSYIIFRTWRVINQCDEMPLDNALTHVQTIRVEDADGPDIQCPEDEVVSTQPHDCTANYMVPEPTFIDGCSDVTYQVAVDGDTLTYDPTNIYLLTGLELGEHEIRYIATDECGKYSSCAYTIDVQDLINPTASCDDELNVSIGGGDVENGLYGEARIYATDVDEGSNDNCSDVTVEVRRNFWRDGTCDDSASRWSDWGEYIDFYCCDIAKEITIELRVTDEAGNQTICWMVITPEDKLVPWCYAPENQELTCAALPLTFPGNVEEAYENDFEGTSAMMSALFGHATGTDNCAVDAVVERDPTINLNECGWGTITRRFEAWQWRPEGDANGNGIMDAEEVWRSTNTCSQLITITEIHDFTIDFPEDADADCEDPDIPTIITETVGCDVLSVNIGEPVRFEATGDECYKLSITYDVINWCLWDGEYTGYVLPRMTEDDGEALAVDRAVEGNERPVVTYTTEDGLCIDRRHSDRDGDSSLDNCFSPELPNYGRYVYTQFVKVYDSTAPVVTVGEYGGPTDECPDLEAGQFGDYTGSCDAEVTIPFSVSDECELFDGEGDLVVSIVLAEIDAFAVDANGDGVIKANEFVSDGSVVGNITDNGDGTYVFSGTYPIITSAMGPNVVHAIRVLFEDGCGNQVSEYIEFDVIDCKGPAPICINGLTVTLMPTGDGSCAMAIWASDFEGSPIYDCTGQGPETHPETGDPRVTKYAIYRQSTVEAAGEGFVPDPAQTGITLTQDDDETTIVYIYAFDEEGNYDFCETYVLVQEHITCGGPGMNPSIAGVIATEVGETVENVEVSLNGGMSQTMITNADGAFMFVNLTPSFDYTVTPYHNTDLLNGVSTFDLVLMSKHILGVGLLDSPYKMIAADVNRSNTITTLDMIQLRKLILNIDTEFSNNTSWRFVETAYNFPQPTNPWSETFPELINFNNLTVGSLGADFVAVKVGDVNGSASPNAQSGDDRSLNGIFNLEVDDVDMKAGNTYTVSFTANDIVEGFQGTLMLNSTEFVSIEYALATAQNFGLRYADQGMITMSFNEEYNSNDVLFSIVVRATEDAKLSETLSIGSKYTAAEAYRNDNTMNLGVDFAKELPSLNAFALYQNIPNPFQGETLIGFYLPEDGAVTISIADVTGKQLLFLSDNYSKGYNTLQVTSEMLQQVTGVLSYTLTSGEFTATKKMIIVN